MLPVRGAAQHRVIPRFHRTLPNNTRQLFQWMDTLQNFSAEFSKRNFYTHWAERAPTRLVLAIVNLQSVLVKSIFNSVARIIEWDQRVQVLVLFSMIYLYSFLKKLIPAFYPGNSMVYVIYFKKEWNDLELLKLHYIFNCKNPITIMQTKIIFFYLIALKNLNSLYAVKCNTLLI